MDRLVRTFVALRCGASARRALHARAQALADGDRALRVPAETDFHITLQFLGDTPQTEIATIGRALAEAAAPIPPIAVRYRGLGAFPDAGRPRVIWTGVVEDEDPGDRLETLVERMRGALGTLGYPPERRRFHAHVTLARVRGRPRPAVLAALESDGDKALGGEILSELKLILSDPSQRPYHYIDLTTIPLEGIDPAG